MDNRNSTPRAPGSRRQPASTSSLDRAAKTVGPRRQSTAAPLEEIASRWVVLNAGGDPDKHDRDAFAAWYAADSLHARTYDELFDVWHKLSSVDAGAIRAKHRRRITPLVVFATALVAASSALFYNASSLRIAALADVSTPTGEVRSVRLADGSNVTLDADSAISIHFGAAARNIHLLRGRALFEVAHDSTRPFVVHTDNAEATALGTRFVVEALSEHSRVAVLQSRVAVRCAECATPDVTQVLTPGHEADVDVAGIRGLRDANPAAIAGWSHGELTFENVPLADALVDLQRYTHRRIWLINRSAGERLVSGLVDQRHPDAAVRALAAAAKLKVCALPGVLLVGSPENIFRKG